MYEQYLKFVKEYFRQHGGYYPPDSRYNFRGKFFHTLRVLRWCKTISKDLPTANLHVLYTACIFHDVGYAEGKADHAGKSASIFTEYAIQNQLDSTFTEQVAFLTKNHSNKELLNNPATSPELILLMEADLLDEEGALRVIWYSATKAIQGADDYSDFYNFIQMGTNKRPKNPMITPLAREIWERKMELVNKFSDELLVDVDTDTSFL